MRIFSKLDQMLTGEKAQRFAKAVGAPVSVLPRFPRKLLVIVKWLFIVQAILAFSIALVFGGLSATLSFLSVFTLDAQLIAASFWAMIRLAVLFGIVTASLIPFVRSQHRGWMYMFWTIVYLNIDLTFQAVNGNQSGFIALGVFLVRYILLYQIHILFSESVTPAPVTPAAVLHKTVTPTNTTQPIQQQKQPLPQGTPLPNIAYKPTAQVFPQTTSI